MLGRCALTAAAAGGEGGGGGGGGEAGEREGDLESLDPVSSPLCPLAAD